MLACTPLRLISVSGCARQELASLLWGCAELAHMGAASLAEEAFVAARSWTAPLGAEVRGPYRVQNLVKTHTFNALLFLSVGCRVSIKQQGDW